MDAQVLDGFPVYILIEVVKVNNNAYTHDIYTEQVKQHIARENH